jgi:4-carboxymuconolactone decarboxylase
MTDTPPEVSDPDLPSFDQVRYERGLRILRQWGGDSGGLILEALAQVSPDLAHYVVAWGFGELQARQVLSARDRELLILGMLTTLGGCDAELELHIGAALDVGLSAAEVVEALVQSAAYCGMPRALNATLVAHRALAARGLLPVPSALTGGGPAER